jgi:adenylate kinase
MIGVSGTPGTGKSTLAKQLATFLKLPLIDITELVKSKKIKATFDKSAKVWDVEPADIDSYIKESKSTGIIDSHLSHHLKCVDMVIVCTCALPLLAKRLEARGYSENKVRENLDAEIFDTCYIEAVENGKKAIKIDCTKPATSATIKRIANLILHH